MQVLSDIDGERLHEAFYRPEGRDNWIRADRARHTSSTYRSSSTVTTSINSVAETWRATLVLKWRSFFGAASSELKKFELVPIDTVDGTDGIHGNLAKVFGVLHVEGEQNPDLHFRVNQKSVELENDCVPETEGSVEGVSAGNSAISVVSFTGRVFD